MATQSLSYKTTIHERMLSAATRHALLREAFNKIGLEPDVDRWYPDAAARKQIVIACAELEAVVPGAKPGSCSWNGAYGVRDGFLRNPRPCRSLKKMGSPAASLRTMPPRSRNSSVQRRAGASFIVFASPAQWWLEYYSELHRYLRTRFSCVLENERLQVFRL
jgi:hypothetical protein